MCALTSSLTVAFVFLFLFPFAFCWLSMLASLLFSGRALLPRTALCFFVSLWSFSFSTSVNRILFWVRVSSFAGFEALKFRVKYTIGAHPLDSTTVTVPKSGEPPVGLLEFPTDVSPWRHLPHESPLPSPDLPVATHTPLLAAIPYHYKV